MMLTLADNHALPALRAADWPCVMDIEASGFGRHSYPIEIGYVLPDGRSRCMLVKPEPHWTHWDLAAQALHGIAPAKLQAHGRTVMDVARTLNDDLEGRTVYCDGWAHDYAWLATLFEEAGIRPHFKLDSVGQLLDERRLSRLADARSAAMSELGLARHRASHDARALQHALAQLSVS